MGRSPTSSPTSCAACYMKTTGDESEFWAIFGSTPLRSKIFPGEGPVRTGRDARGGNMNKIPDLSVTQAFIVL